VPAVLLHQVGRYLAQPSVLEQIGAVTPWVMENDKVEQALRGEYSRDVSGLVAGLLDSKVAPVVIDLQGGFCARRGSLTKSTQT
jgi:hypothetical protein